MALTAQEFRPILIARLRNFLLARAPDKDRGLWVSKKAKRIGISEGALEKCFYGDPDGVPQGDNLLAIIAHFVEIEGPSVAQELFGDPVGVCCVREPAEADERLAEIDKLAGDMQAVIRGDKDRVS